MDEKARQERLEKMRLIEAALRNHPGWEITFGEGNSRADAQVYTLR